jgi:hypothetical protein
MVERGQFRSPRSRLTSSPVPRWIVLILLVPLALAVGFLLALFLPKGGHAPGAPTPILTTTTTIPSAEP